MGLRTKKKTCEERKQGEITALSCVISYYFWHANFRKTSGACKKHNKKDKQQSQP